MWWLWTATALAGDPATEVRSALAAGDVRAARDAIEAFDKALGSARTIVSTEDLAMRYQAEGAVADLRSREKEMVAAFQAAWVVAPTGSANPDVLTRPDLVAAYNQIQSSVFQRTPIDLRWVDFPDAPVLVDGQPQGQQPVLRGRHHVQVQCADGSWSSKWSTLNRSEDWGHACPDGALAPVGAVVPVDGQPHTVVATIDPPIDGSTPSEGTPPTGSTPPPSKPAEPKPRPADQNWYERSIQWVKDFELPRSPKGRLLLGGPVVGLGTGGELQFVPGGDSGGVFTTLGVSHMPFHVGSDGVGVVRLTAGELGVGYQPSRKGAVGVQVMGGASIYHDHLLYTDGYLYVNAAAGARWDNPGTGRIAFVGLAAVGNFERVFVAPRASIGWQF